MLIDTSAIRQIDRIEEPSQSIESICARLATVSLFICRVYELLCLPSSILLVMRLISESEPAILRNKKGYCSLI